MSSIPQEFRMAHNPIFSSLLLREIVESYTNKAGTISIPSSLCLIGYALSIDSRIRSECAKPALFNLLKIIEVIPEITIGLADRSRSLSTFVLEALVFSCEIGVLDPLNDGSIRAKPNALVKKPKKPPFDGELKQARAIGTGFGKIGNSATIHTVLGVRP